MFKSVLNKDKWFARVLSGMLALSFFVHSGYVNATIMQCHSSGKSEVSLGQRDFCCAGDSFDYEALTAKCCGFDKTEKKFDSQQGERTSQEFFIPMTFTGKAVIFSDHFILKTFRSSCLKSPPDGERGPDLLKRIGVFRL